jgi:hypothetical protein
MTPLNPCPLLLNLLLSTPSCDLLLSHQGLGRMEFGLGGYTQFSHIPSVLGDPMNQVWFSHLSSHIQTQDCFSPANKGLAKAGFLVGQKSG